MTLIAHNLTVNRRTNEPVTVTVPIYSSEPGVITASAAGCTFPDGDTVTIAGTRTWRNGLKHGQYLARANCLQSRDPAAWLVEIKAADLVRMTGFFIDATILNIPIATNIRTDINRRVNWSLFLNVGRNVNDQVIRQGFVQSRSSTSDEGRIISTGFVQNDGTATIRMIWAVVGGNIYFYYTNGTTHDYTTARNTILSNMGTNEIFAIQFPCKLAKIDADITGAGSQAARQAFFSAGTLPAGLAASYQGGHEIDPAAPRFWDTSGNNLDLSDVDVDYWPEAAASGDYTDDPGDPVVPASSIRVTIPAGVSSPVTLSLSRPRAGVPSRASEAEKYETTTGTITLVDIPTEVYVGPAQHVRSRF